MNTINQYICPVCGGVITTINRDEGTTPFYLSCRALPGCSGRMFSQLYQVDQTLTPTHEWYKPAKIKGTPEMRQHLKAGGLLIREIK